MTNVSKTKKRRPFGLIFDIIGELKKVVWLTRGEAAYLTMLVLLVAGAMGIFLGLLDFGLTELVDAVFIG